VVSYDPQRETVSIRGLGGGGQRVATRCLSRFKLSGGDFQGLGFRVQGSGFSKHHSETNKMTSRSQTLGVGFVTLGVIDDHNPESNILEYSPDSFRGQGVKRANAGVIVRGHCRDNLRPSA